MAKIALSKATFMEKAAAFYDKLSAHLLFTTHMPTRFRINTRPFRALLLGFALTTFASPALAQTSS
jgi:hypothetical protein